ncbi:methionine ABC transporter substrate-binding protein [Micrococcales bacterium 31B]|nr:methionine ABC transporter substrate-binding protein [Micrococcales bacterium 31B]
MKKILAGLTAALLATSLLTACGGGTTAAEDGGTIRIGVTDGAKAYWKTFTAEAKKQGIEVEIVPFTDYAQPNPALKQGQLEMNEFQHIQYLATYNVNNNDTLKFIGATAVYPLPLYSEKYKSVAEFPAGSQVVIPNDVVNQARALLVLQAAGLLSLKDGGSTTSTPADIEAGAKVEVAAVDASQTPQALKSAAGAIINNNYAATANIPDTQIVYSVDPDNAASLPYVNGFVVRAEDVANPTYAKLVDIYHSPTVYEQVKKDLGTGIERKNTPDELNAELAKVEAQVKAAK